MKTAIKLTLAVVLMMSATSLFAQKFGRINTSEIIASMPEMKQMQVDMENFGKTLNEGIEAINVEYANKLQEYQKSYNTLPEATREMKAQDLQNLITRREQYQQAAQQDYEKKYNELMAPIIEKAKKRHRQGIAGRRLPGRLRHLDGRPRGIRRGQPHRHCSRGEEGAGHHRYARRGSPRSSRQLTIAQRGRSERAAGHQAMPRVKRRDPEDRSAASDTGPRQESTDRSRRQRTEGREQTIPRTRKIRRRGYMPTEEKQQRTIRPPR